METVTPMRSERELDELYERAHKSPGWLGCLLEAKTINPSEERYLLWRDECDWETQKRLKVWTEQVERAGGIDMVNAETPSERFEAVCKVVERIEQKCRNFTSEMAEAYRDLWGYRKFLNMRAVLKLELDGPDLLPEHKLQKAREYRLDDLLKDKLKRRFMKCPVHPEKHGSFFVTSYGYCFGCLRSWDAISWLQDFDGMSFKQAVEYLCNL